MSRYYASFASDNFSTRAFHMRVWFAGLLLSAGVLLYLYKGVSGKENVALSMVGLFGLRAVLFPKNWECGQNCPPINLLWRSLI